MLWFGGDYNPEQWPESVWPDDLKLMREAKVNLVTVGVFSWSSLQPAPDRFDFGWLDRVLDGLDAAGIGVALATPTASPPPWFTARHAQSMPVRRDGVRLTHGSRDTYCVNAPAYREASREITRAVAARYSGHPAVRLWHVHNEYGSWCFCDHCAVAFREFLRARYGGIDAVNEAWTAEFWSQRVADFAEILPPRATQYLPNPAQELDYRRFMSESLLSHYREARDLIRAGSGLPITTNFVLGGWVPVDHARWAREVDLVAIDHYPATVATEPAERAWAADLARGWALAAGHEDGRWLLMEHAPGAVFESGVTRRLAPGAMTEAARAYLDRGAAGIMYFQWRASRGGAEQWHPAMVPHAGPSSRTFTEISALGAEMAGWEHVRPRAEIAVIFDEESMWAWQAPHLPTHELDYAEFAQATHRAAGALGAVDVIPVTAPLSGYRLVCVPALYLMTSATHAALREYAASGGRLLITFGTGLVDVNARVTWDSLADLIGARIAEIGPLLPGERVALDGGGSGSVWCDEIEPVTAEVLTRTEDGAAVLVRSGGVFYLGTRLEGDAYAELIAKLA